MGSIVSLVRVKSSRKDTKSSVSEALSLLEFKLDKPVESVAIKPNLCYYWNADTGYTTDPNVVSGVINWVRENYGSDVDIKVVEADATAMRTKLAFPILGYEKLAKEKNVELFNLSQDTIMERRVHVNGRKIKFKVPKFLLDVDLFINVPKLKIMRETFITCAMKNIFGCIASPRKIVYHPILSEAIVGIKKVLRPHLTIVDGIVALGRYPFKLGLIMSGPDPFSVDWVASQVMGYNPWKVKFLRMAINEGIGDPKQISTSGESVVVFKKVFPKAGLFESRWSTKTQLRLLRLYNRIAGDVLPPDLEE